ncbi:MAG: helix-turn-helix transcriptional regulator [Pseudonocardia sp.]
MDVLDHDGATAERAWRAGDMLAAIEAADRALAAGEDTGSRAAGVAAAAAAADGALRDAAQLWRAVGGVLESTTGVWALGRAGLTAALAGDLPAAARDVADACRRMPEPAPRGLGVLVCGAQAAMTALRGGFPEAARTLVGLAAATVPADPFAVERWDELAATVVAAAGDDRTAREMLDAVAGPPTVRRTLLAGWIDLRRARLAQARDALTSASATPLMRRNAVLAAAVGAGLARRSGDGAALGAMWHRASPAVAGTDVEALLVDVWGELSVAAAHVSPTDRDSLAAAIAATVARAGSPSWLVASEAWWRTGRAVVAQDAEAAADAAATLATLAGPGPHPVDRTTVLAGAAAAWASVLAGAPEAAEVVTVAGLLTAAGRRHEAAALCGAAAEGCTDAAGVRALLGTGRDLRTTVVGPAGPLSEREQEVGALVVDGLTHKEIGARLYISPKTVEQHVARLRRKLTATNRAELVAALRAHLPGA